MLTEPADVNPAGPNVGAISDEEMLTGGVFDIASSYIVSRSLHVIVELGVPDALGEEAATDTDLAAAVGADADALGRLLRLLVGHGFFAVRGAAFVHSPSSRLLRSDHPRSMRAAVQVLGSELYWGTFGALLHTLRTGEPSAGTAYPGGIYAYLAEHPAAGSAFNTAMATRSRAYVRAVTASYDFSPFTTVGDIGGGHGQLLRAILDAAPNVQGVLFDLPHVIHEAEAFPHDRLALQSGNFFKDPLPRCDLYALMEVIHNWNDAEALAILQAVRRAASAQSRVLIIERMVSSEPGPDRAKLLDVAMLCVAGGRQRTRQEYASSLERAGFAVEREIPTASDVTILEAVVR
jgi:hypothetical protein